MSLLGINFLNLPSSIANFFAPPQQPKVVVDNTSGVKLQRHKATTRGKVGASARTQAQALALRGTAIAKPDSRAPLNFKRQSVINPTGSSTGSSTRRSTGSSTGSSTASKASKASKSSTRFTPKEWDPYSEPKQRLQISLDASLTEYNSKVQNLEQEVRQFLRNISKSSPKINQEMADILMLEIKNLDIGKITCISGLDKRHGRDEIPYNKKGERVYQASFRALAEQVQDKLNIRMVSLKKTPTSARGILNRFNTSTNKLKELKSQIFEYTTEGQEVARQRTREQDRKDDARSGQEPTFLQRFLG